MKMENVCVGGVSTTSPSRHHMTNMRLFQSGMPTVQGYSVTFVQRSTMANYVFLDSEELCHASTLALMAATV